jgi:hypothetical protein
VPAPGDYDDGEIGGMIGKGTEVFGENLSQCRFVNHKPHSCPDANPDRRSWKPATNRFSYETVKVDRITNVLVDKGKLAWPILKHRFVIISRTREWIPYMVDLMMASF